MQNQYNYGDYASANEAAEREKDEKRRRNRRYNAIIYSVAGVLVLLGIFIILRSETTLFTCNSAGKPFATFPPGATYPAADNDPFIINVPGTPSPNPFDPSASKDPAAANPTYPPPVDTTLQPGAIAPTAIYFNEHNVSCTVQPVGVEPDGTMQSVPSHNIAGWYKYGPAPNQAGNCIIAGHNRYSGQLGSFSLLHNGLAVGDGVTVQLSDGSYRFYRVVSINTYRYDAVPDSVMQVWGDTRLTLITCLGDYDYDLQMSISRVVAVCEPVN